LDLLLNAGESAVEQKRDKERQKKLAKARKSKRNLKLKSDSKKAEGVPEEQSLDIAS